MRVIVDINHPANVHYFKHLIGELKLNGEEVLVTASEKEVSFKLLDALGIEYVPLGSYGDSIMKKLVSIMILDIRMLLVAKKFRPDLIIGHGTIRGAHTSAMMGVPCICTEDTEHARFAHFLYTPFANKILTPDCFEKNIGSKQVKFNGYTELLYLHPDRYEYDSDIEDELELNKNERLIIVRFVSWEAGHDIGQHGITDKIDLIKKLESYGRVMISSEGPLPAELESYRLRTSPEKLHHVLKRASLYIGEGATTAMECAMLGTHAIYVNTLPAGTLAEVSEKYGLISDFSRTSFKDSDVIGEAQKLLNDPALEEKSLQRMNHLLKEKDDVTGFLLSFISSYVKR